MDSRQEKPQRLGHRPVLDGLRAIAVALVVAIHVGLLAAGYIGVDVFLALSGFLITILLVEEWERAGAISLRRFYRRRARRLLPALLLLVACFSAVMIIFDPFPGQWPLGRLVATTLLFVNNWVSTLAPNHGSVLGALSPTWTLAQEVQFYLLWPPILMILLRLRLPPRTILALLVLAILALLAGGLLAQHADANYNVYTSPLDRGAELLLGAAAAIVWRERLVPSVLLRPIIGWISVAGIAFVVAAAEPSAPAWYLTVAALGAILIVNLLSQPDVSPETRLSGRIPARMRGLPARALGSRPMVYTGKISYGIYLFHVPIYYLLWTYAPVGPAYLYWPIVFLLSFAAAAASWELVESPILRGARRDSRPRRRASDARLARLARIRRLALVSR
jgi:peptidoglycan/LPS O-acetylase OafA/YrhL